MRYTAPWVAISGAGLVLICDLLGRIMHPSLEIPISTTMGIIGSLFYDTTVALEKASWIEKSNNTCTDNTYRNGM